VRGADWLVLAAGCALAPALAAQHRPAGIIGVGQTVQGRLEKSDVLLSPDSTYAQEWQLDAAAGEVVTIDLGSDSLDAYLVVYGPGLEGDLQDDDSGGNCNARLTVRFPRSGAYFIAVTSTEKRQTGPFTLSAASGVRPKSLARCHRDR
jgi:hypothetical protein